MPHKLQVSKFCDEISSEAKAIGAINTLIVSDDPQSRRRKILGDNTDWSGLVDIIMSKSPPSPHAKSGLVIGAGGASRAALYALHQTGVKTIYLTNRTLSAAQKIAQDFAPLFNITVLGDVNALGKKSEIESGPDIIIGTIPAEKTHVKDFPSSLFSREKGLCIDMSYKPRSTPLLKAAARNSGWVGITGVQVLLAQAFDQSELWTGLKAPREVMTEALYSRDGKIGLE